MKQKTWMTLEASQALTDYMAALQTGILHAAELKHSCKRSSACIELVDVLEVMPEACGAWLETIHGQTYRRETSKVA